jgi:hypothetical protein
MALFTPERVYPQQPRVVSLIEGNYDSTPQPERQALSYPVYVPLVQKAPAPSQNNNMIIFGTVAIVISFFALLGFILALRR